MSMRANLWQRLEIRLALGVSVLGCSGGPFYENIPAGDGGLGEISTAEDLAGLAEARGGRAAGGFESGGAPLESGGANELGGAGGNQEGGRSNHGGRAEGGEKVVEGGTMAGGAVTTGGKSSSGGFLGLGGRGGTGGTEPPGGTGEAGEIDQGGADGTHGGSEEGGDEPGGANDAGGSGYAGHQPDGGSSGSGLTGADSWGGWSGRGGHGGSPDGGTIEGGAQTSTGGTGAAPSAGSAGSGAGGSPDDDTIPTVIPTPSNGAGELRDATTVLHNAANGGQDVYDFENQRIGVNSTSDCDSGEDQLTVFEVEDGVTVRNLIIAGGTYGGNGIVCLGNCTLEYVYWEDVCEDAATNTMDGATMTLNHVIALHASNLVFQHNAKGGSTTVVRNSYVSDLGKLWRSCGDCTDNGGPRHLVVDNVQVEGVVSAVAGANQNYGDTVTITDLLVKGGYSTMIDSPKICTEYIAVTDHQGEPTKVANGASQWNTTSCRVSQGDVQSW